MPEIVDWQHAAKTRPLTVRAAHSLRRGQLVVFPTETVYGVAASPLVPGAVERLVHCKGRPEDKPLTLAVRGPADATEWVPGLSALGARLARRCWPGPVTLVCQADVRTGLLGRLPEAAQRRVCPSGTLGLRSPDHDSVLGALDELCGPLVLTSANRSGEPDATTAEEAARALGDRVDLIVDGGPCRYGRSSTVVRVEGNSWSVLRAGAVAEGMVKRLACCEVLFVCTGNTCRSPLAEALLKMRLAERLNVPPDELPDRGFQVLSAGLAAASGMPAASEAVEAARELGAGLEQHASRRLTPALLSQADFIVTMTAAHAEALARHDASLGSRIRLLCPEGADVPDPIGCDFPVYRDCAREILRCVDLLLPEILQP